jgi:hypothetical protein
MDLRLSLQRGDVLSFPIAPHGYRFVDLVYVNETELIHHYDFDVPPERLPERGLEQIQVRMEPKYSQLPKTRKLIGCVLLGRGTKHFPVLR